MEEVQRAMPMMQMKSTTVRSLWLSSLLMGGFITALLTIIVGAMLALFNPLHLVGSFGDRVSFLLALSLHGPLLFLLLIVGLVLFSLIAFAAAEPLAVARYLRTIHKDYAATFDQLIPLNLSVRVTLASEPTGEDVAGEPPQEIAQQDLVSKQGEHQLIIGAPGAGKTTAMLLYRYLASQRPWQLIWRRGPIPIYISLEHYGLFIKQALPDSEADSFPSTSILDFLVRVPDPTLQPLRPYLQKLEKSGRLVLLCDGLDEVDNRYFPLVGEELAQTMLDTSCRVIVTSREGDDYTWPELTRLVEDGKAIQVAIGALQDDQLSLCVERFIERQDKHWRHTAGQILQVIERSALRDHCSNPLLLFSLLNVIDTIGVESGKQINTRGRLLHTFVTQLLARSQRAVTGQAQLDERETLAVLGSLAYAMRWAGDCNAIPLSGSLPPNVDAKTNDKQAAHLVAAVQQWLDEHPVGEPFVDETGQDVEPIQHGDLTQAVLFALDAGLIQLGTSNVLRFQHASLAAYFAAEYLQLAYEKTCNASKPVLREEIVSDSMLWCEPIAFWSGLTEHPLALAERIVETGYASSELAPHALAFGLVSVGTAWRPLADESQPIPALPEHLSNLLTHVARDQAQCEMLAHAFTSCATEGAYEIYRSLLPLLTVDGSDAVLILLDRKIIPDMLFNDLQEIVDSPRYEAQVKRLMIVLAQFGGAIVPRAAELCLPAPERSMRLRAAAVNILGGTRDAQGLEPLLARLTDTEPFIASRATSAIVRLGPDLVLARLLQELDQQHAGVPTRRIHSAVLAILHRLVDERDPRRQVSNEQYQTIIEHIAAILTVDYQPEPEVQQQAREILVRQCHSAANTGRADRCSVVVGALVQYIASEDDTAAHNAVLTLREIGSIATLPLLESLRHISGPDAVRVRMVDMVRDIRDPRALPSLLQLIDDPSPVVQQSIAEALYDYAPESITSLIEMVLQEPSQRKVEKAVQVLNSMGEQVVAPIANTLSPVIPERTRLLVQILEQQPDPLAIPALVTLLRQEQGEPLLTLAAIRALGHIPDARVVPPLLDTLSHPDPMMYEEAVDALGQLGDVALDALIAALDVPQETQVTQRVKRALLLMTPFPAEQLIQALPGSSEAQAQQLLLVCKSQGAEAAQALCNHLQDRDERLQTYAYQALGEMPGPVVVPALLEALRRPSYPQAVVSLLLRYPDAAISPLVDLLGESQRGASAARILPCFGPRILRPLIAGLDDQRGEAQQRARTILVDLVQQSATPAALTEEIVHLFYPAPPTNARHILLDVLTKDLAPHSIPALLRGLEDAHLIDDIADAFALLARESALLPTVLHELLQALFIDERRRGAEAALINIGAPAVSGVGELLVHDDPAIAHSAQHILLKIGVPALPFLWSAHSDTTNLARRTAAQDVFRTMPTSVVKDELVRLLGSQRPEDITMATSLLLERVYDDATHAYAEREMIPELVEYIQTHDTEVVNLRIIALLLFLGERTIIDHIIQTLDGFSQHPKQLLYIFLLLGEETQAALLEVFNDSNSSIELRAEVAPILGMLQAPSIIEEYAQKVSSYGLSPSRATPVFPEQLAIALRSLGGLLAGGSWDARKLQELRDASAEGSAEHELFNVLLGIRYEPQLLKLQSDLQQEKDNYKKELLSIGDNIAKDQKRIQELEENLERVRVEHSQRGDELQKASKEQTSLRTSVDQLTKEKNELRTKLDQVSKERDNLRSQLTQQTSDAQKLRTQLDQLLKQLNALNTP